MAFDIKPLDPNAFPADYRRQFQELGYARIPGFINAEEVAMIHENLDRLITDVVPDLADTDVFYEDKADKTSIKQIIRLFQHDDFFEQLYLKSRFFFIAEFMRGRLVVARNMQYFNKPPGIGKPTPPHQDGFYAKLSPIEGMTMWLALEDVDEENGCVRYINGSHKRGVRTHGKTGTLGFSQGITDYGDEDKAAEVCMIAKPGDLLVHDSLTIHRADGNQSADRTRKALGFIYYSARAREDAEAVRKYQEELFREMRATGKM
jgi:phytanoyl-CoA hydroxylase